MSDRDHLEAQKKYIQTKKEARLGKNERQQNPRPPRLDPPPAPTSPWILVAVVFFMLLPLVSLFFILPSAMLTQAPSEDLIIWIQGTESEFLEIKNWLEPEILANDLQWTIAHSPSKYDLVDMLRMGDGDLLIIEADLAEELYAGQALTPLWDKQEGMTWENCFAPFWESQPFHKTFGWAIPRTGSIDEGRHLLTVMRHFALPFSP